MVKRLMLFLLIAAFTGSVVFAQGKAAPDFSLKDLEDKPFNLSESKGKEAVLLFFWTTWCPHCRSAIIDLSIGQDDIEKDGLRLLSVNIREPEARIKYFIEALKEKGYVVDVPILIDKDAFVAKKYAVIGIPTFILINKQGEVTFKGHYFPDDYKSRI